jgi:Protein of unknown function (DUF1214)
LGVADGQRIQPAPRVTFPQGGLPPEKGFWSLTLYNEHHFFSPNALKRYSLGTKNKSLKLATDGSLSIYVQSDSPGAELEANWLPAPKDADFSLYVRTYSRRGHHGRQVVAAPRQQRSNLGPSRAGFAKSDPLSIHRPDAVGPERSLCDAPDIVHRVYTASSLRHVSPASRRR